MTSELDEAATLDQMGPVDYFVVGFRERGMSGEALPLLLDLVDRGIIRILDLAFIRKEEDGRVTALETRSTSTGDAGPGGGPVFEGRRSGCWGRTTSRKPRVLLEPGSSAGVLVYENVWAAPFASAVRGPAATSPPAGASPSRSWSRRSTPWKPPTGPAEPTADTGVSHDERTARPRRCQSAEAPYRGAGSPTWRRPWPPRWRGWSTAPSCPGTVRRLAVLRVTGPVPWRLPAVVERLTECDVTVLDVRRCRQPRPGTGHRP